MIAIFDIGKTNKKCFIFDQDYRLVWEKSAYLPESTDEDGDPCEDINALKAWISTTIQAVLNDPAFDIKAINCTSYGASFVHLDSDGQVLTPLYNYLKPFPDALKNHFYSRYGSDRALALETGSPILGHLNAGLQLYRLMVEKPLVFEKIKYAFHLPQYVAYWLAKEVGDVAVAAFAASETTSIGCHTMLWDFRHQDYHAWVKATGIAQKLPPIKPSDSILISQHPVTKGILHLGLGLHDSSAALIPYMAYFKEPFILISTGTWCISLNPYNDDPLTMEALDQDCLCYLNAMGKPVKAARFFGGHEHDLYVKTLSETFQKPLDYFKNVRFDPSKLPVIEPENWTQSPQSTDFKDYETAYHYYMSLLVGHQYRSTMLIHTPDTKQIFVDGGFSKNEVYMHCLARAFPEIPVFAATVSEATALGAAIILHQVWNQTEISKNLITLKRYYP